MKIIFTVLITSFFLFAATASGATNTESEELIDKLISEYNEQMKNIRDLTLIREKSISYQIWDQGSGYRFRTEKENGNKYLTVYDGEYYTILDAESGNIMTREKMDLDPHNYYAYLRSLDPDHAGVENLNGYSCYVLELKNADLKGMRDPRTGRELLSSFENNGIEGVDIEEAVADARFYIDDNKWIIRKIEIDVGNIMYEGKPRNIRKTVDYKDFRKKRGLLIPFHTVQSFHIDLTSEEEDMIKQARKSIRKIRERLEDMPAVQRRFAESLMESRIEEMEELLIDAEIRYEYKLKKVKVNTGLKDELFVISE